MTIINERPSLKSTRDIDLRGPEGNAWALMGITADLLRQMGRSKENINAVLEDMKSSDYEHLLEVMDAEVGILVNLYR